MNKDETEVISWLNEMLPIIKDSHCIEQLEINMVIQGAKPFPIYAFSKISELNAVQDKWFHPNTLQLKSFKYNLWGFFSDPMHHPEIISPESMFVFLEYLRRNEHMKHLFYFAMQIYSVYLENKLYKNLTKDEIEFLEMLIFRFSHRKKNS